MKLLIIKKILDKYGITPDQYWNLYCLYNKKPTMMIPWTLISRNNLISKRFIKYDPELEVDSIRPKGKEIIEDKIEDKNISVSSWIEDYRAIFKGIKAGSMGDRIACTLKMGRFLIVYPEYDKDTILAAAKMYVDSIEDPRYAQRADYLISKTDIDKIKESRLASFCEEVKAGGKTVGKISNTLLL